MPAFFTGSMCLHRSYTTVNHSPFNTNPKISNSDFLSTSQFLKLRTGRKIIIFFCSKFKVIYRNFIMIIMCLEQSLFYDTTKHNRPLF